MNPLLKLSMVLLSVLCAPITIPLVVCVMSGLWTVSFLADWSRHVQNRL